MGFLPSQNRTNTHTHTLHTHPYTHCSRTQQCSWMAFLHKTSLLVEQWRGKLFKGLLIPDMHSHPRDRGGLDCIRITSEQHNNALQFWSFISIRHRDILSQTNTPQYSEQRGKCHLLVTASPYKCNPDCLCVTKRTASCFSISRTFLKSWQALATCWKFIIQ